MQWVADSSTRISQTSTLMARTSLITWFRAGSLNIFSYRGKGVCAPLTEPPTNKKLTNSPKEADREQIHTGDEHRRGCKAGIDTHIGMNPDCLWFGARDKRH